MEVTYKSDDPKTYYIDAEHANVYKAKRKPMDVGLIQKITDSLKLKFDPKTCTVVDVGCGSGQATIPMADYFSSVTGVDPSPAQIAEAQKETCPSNVKFIVGNAEALPFADSSVHLVHARSALHWFDIPKFFAEVDRVLIPGGILAISGGEKHVIDGIENPDILFKKYLDKYRKVIPGTEKLKLVKNMYEDVEMPYPSTRHAFHKKTDQYVNSVLGFLETQYDFTHYKRMYPEEAVEDLETMRSTVMKLIGKPNEDPNTTLVPSTCRMFVIICEKPE